MTRPVAERPIGRSLLLMLQSASMPVTSDALADAIYPRKRPSNQHKSIKRLVWELRHDGETRIHTVPGGYVWDESSDGRPLRFTRDLLSRALRFRESGMPWKEIAEGIGTTSISLQSALSKRGMTRRDRVDRDDRIAELVEAGLTYREIAQRVGCANGLVGFVAIRDGLVGPRAQTSPSRPYDDRIQSMRVSGMSVREIAIAMSMPRSTVNHRLLTLARNMEIAA